MPYVLLALKGSLVLVAVVFFVSGIDDFFFDVFYGVRSFYRRLFVLPKHERLTEQHLRLPEEKPIAVLLPAWSEAAVIGTTLDHAVSTLCYSNYRFFVGCYPNDEATIAAASEVAARSDHVQIAICPHDGPTNKSDCLNAIYGEIEQYERDHEMRFNALVVHDAEDILHPLSFKLAGGEELARAQVETLAKSYLDKRDRHFRVVFRQLVGAFTIEIVASVALLAVGGFLVIERQLSIGQLVAAELIVTAVVASIAKLGGKVEIFYDLVAAVDKLGEILDLPLERPDGEILPPVGGASVGLVLDEVEIDFEPGVTPLRVSFKVEPGERLAIAGIERDTTAAIDAIFGLRALSAGVIEMDGHDVRDLALRELRRRVALVRGTEIFPGCILDNLRAANADLTAEQAWEALRQVGLAEVVKSLPEGLQTPILRDGAPLSRTQAIALTVARAVAGKPSLLILDRTLDRIDPEAGVRIADRLSANRNSALLIVAADAAVRERMDRQVQISDTIRHEGEAA